MKRLMECISLMHKKRYDLLMPNLISNKTPVAFFSSATVENALVTIHNLRQQGLNINYLITLSTSTQPFKTDIKIVHLNAFNSIQPPPQYVFSNTFVDVKKASLTNVENIISFQNPGYIKYSYNMFMEHLPELFEVYNSLIDEESKKTFCGYWLAKVSNNLKYAHFASTPQYICTGFTPKPGEIVIDAGVCDGGTSARFAGYGCKVIGFEMDKQNFELASKAAAENNFTVENLGLGSYKHQMNYFHDANNIGGSKLLASGGDTTTITTLDFYAAEHKLPSIDFIKMDVEGAELDILRGAAASIARWKPKLAISAYHKMDDFWTLMNFIKSVRPDYEFAMRQYGAMRSDTPFLFTEKIENEFAELGLTTTLDGFGECVLLAR